MNVVDCWALSETAERFGFRVEHFRLRNRAGRRLESDRSVVPARREVAAARLPRFVRVGRKSRSYNLVLLGLAEIWMAQAAGPSTERRVIEMTRQR